MSDIPQWVQEKIDEVRENNLTELDLSVEYKGTDTKEKLTEIPDEILGLIQLKRLDLSGNNIQTIPDDISLLQNLEYLSVVGDFDIIPDDIGNLQNLVELRLGGDSSMISYVAVSHPVGNFSKVPESINNLKRLKTLNISGKLDTVPLGLTSLHQLTTLEFVGIFPNFPESITELRNLNTLRIFGRFEYIPDTIDNLSQLEVLILVGEFTQISKSIFKSYNINRLVLYGRYSEIPSDIVNLTKLKRLAFFSDNLSVPPAEIIGAQLKADIEAIRNYFLSLQDDEDHLYEAKLLILGEGGAGKTTLAKKIENPKYQLVENEKSTEGIDVTQWEFLYDDDNNYQVNIWDFGGQEIYHATHQFFLTNRSLYVIVADNRKEDTDFNYWLNVVELLAGDSPVLIINNKKQDREKQIGEPQLRARFSNIKDILAVNLAKPDELPRLLDEIKHQMRNLSHIGTPLPGSWVSIREKLEQDDRNYITIEQYRDLCDDCNLGDRSRQGTVIGYLHDLGVCLHFKDDVILKRYVILNPHWGTTAVYTVLDNKRVQSNFGRFTQADLESIWSDSSYDDMHDELLRLMMRFKLCYEIPGEENHYIAPQLLSENQPEYDWDDADNLNLRYRYDFMPKGLVTRLIVAMHPRIVDDLVWRTGVILRHNTAHAEVTEHYHQKEIRIRVTGFDKKVLLGIIMYQLELIHKTYHGLAHNRLIPCNCDEHCLNNSSPYYFKYNVLINAIQKNEGQIQCQISFDMVDARQLIDDVIPRPQELQGTGAETVVHEVHNHFYGDDPRQVIGRDIAMADEKKKNIIDNKGQIGNLNQDGSQDGATITININVGALDSAPENSQLAELRDLVAQLQAELENVAQEQPDDAELVKEFVNTAIEEATKDKPNKTRLKITGDSLKTAAQNLLTVAPIAVQIATVLLGIG